MPHCLTRSARRLPQLARINTAATMAPQPKTRSMPTSVKRAQNRRGSAPPASRSLGSLRAGLKHGVAKGQADLGDVAPAQNTSVEAAIEAESRLTAEQKSALIAVLRSMLPAE